jgi:hypothetical protein
MTQIKDVVVSYVDAFNRGDLDALCELFTPDALIWGVLGWGSVEQVRPIWKDLTECLTMKLHIEDIISEGNIVAVRYTETGKLVKPFRGTGKIGNEYELIAMEWFEISNGKIARRWGARDFASQARQLDMQIT